MEHEPEISKGWCSTSSPTLKPTFLYLSALTPYSLASKQAGGRFPSRPLRHMCTRIWRRLISLTSGSDMPPATSDHLMDRALSASGYFSLTERSDADDQQRPPRSCGRWTLMNRR